ncbi:hypothetical protein D3C81_2145780 [compost metagenome]
MNIVRRIEHEADLVPEQLQWRCQLGKNIINQGQVVLERRPFQFNRPLKRLA